MKVLSKIVVISLLVADVPVVGLRTLCPPRESFRSLTATSNFQHQGLTSAGCVQPDASGNFASTRRPCSIASGIFSIDQGNRAGTLGGQPAVWASHQTATFIVNTNGTATVTCQVARCGGLEVGNGIMIEQVGPRPPQPAPTSRPVITHTGRESGAHTYKIIIVTADPSVGISGASPVSNTLLSMPALNCLGVSDYMNFNTSPGIAGATAPVYLIYSSYDSGPYTFVTAVNELNGGATNETADFGERPPDGRGWPVTISGAGYTGQRENFWSYVVSMPDSTHLVLNDAVPIAATGAKAQGDDSLAVQVTELMAEANGGGTITFGPFTYNLWRPQYWNGWAWSSSVASSITFSAHIAVDASGMNFVGAGKDSTTVIGGPEANVFGSYFSLALEKTRPWTQTYYAMNTVNEGDQWITLSAAANASHFAVGDDVWMFFGSFFSTTCPALGRTPGANCHFAETNSITAIDSTLGRLYLKYPSNKTYYADSIGNPFGVVDVKPTVGANRTSATVSLHGISFHDITFKIRDPLVFDGIVFDESLYSMRFPTGMSSGVRYGGMGRNLNIHDNDIVIGDGSGWFHSENEFDLDADIRLVNNDILFLSAPRVAGSWSSFGINLTEGTSNVRAIGNHIVNGQWKQENAANNVVVSNNHFLNSPISVGCLTSQGCNVGSFGTPDGWIITNNTLSGVNQPDHGIVLESQNVVRAQVISGNTLSITNTPAILACIQAASGIISNNVCYTNSNTNFPNGVEIKPQVNASEGVPALPVAISGNLIYAQNQGNGVVIDDPGTSWAGVINITSNTEYITAGTGDTITSTSHTPNVGVLGEEIAVRANAAYSPTILGSTILQSDDGLK